MSQLSDLYSTLASVAAITTAIQTLFAIPAFNECSAKVTILNTTPLQKRADKKYLDAEAERGPATLKNSFLNVPPTIVNAFAIITWGYLVYRYPTSDEWLYFLPWLGVAIAALFLILLVVTSMVALWTREWVYPIVATSILGILAIWLMVAGEFRILPF